VKEDLKALETSAAAESLGTSSKMIKKTIYIQEKRS